MAEKSQSSLASDDLEDILYLVEGGFLDNDDDLIKEIEEIASLLMTMVTRTVFLLLKFCFCSLRVCDFYWSFFSFFQTEFLVSEINYCTSNQDKTSFIRFNIAEMESDFIEFY